MGMVMTLVFVVHEDAADEAMDTARSASREHPARVLGVILGDPPLFPRHEEVELSWKILDPILAHWAKKGRPDKYPAGTWGPESADEMLARDGRAWRRP
jgi:glucose-6-phosphate 1-dehydrogenase